MTGQRVPDFSKPHPARMYSYYLGGKDHLAADREAAEKVIAAYPETRKVARANRRFLTRAVWYLAEHGIQQFIELGAGMPAEPNVHEVARQVQPDARVVYVDNDPVVITHHRARWASCSHVGVVDADIRAPQTVLNDPELTELIDFDQPVAVLCAAVLHFIACSDRPDEIMAAFRWQTVPGSYMVLSHATSDGADPALLAGIMDGYAESTVPAVPRSAAEIAAFLTGVELVEPGLVDVSLWRPDTKARATKIRILGGVGQKP